MKRRWSLSLAIFGALVVGACTYIEPQLGQLPEGGRLESVHASAQYRDGEFRNEVASPRRPTGVKFLLAVIRGRIESRDRPSPPVALPVVKTDLSALPVDKDMVVWLGHSSFFVQLSGKRLLIDPVFSDHAAPLPWMVRAFEGTNIYSVQDLPPIDAVLITHDHYDHLDYATMKALEAKTGLVIAGLGNGAHLQHWGYPPEKIREVDWNTSVTLGPDLQIHVLPAQHYSGRFMKRNQSLWASYALQTTQRRLYFSGDTGFGPHFERIAQRFDDFDLVALDAGQYNERWTDIHMTPEEASHTAEMLAARSLLIAHA
jgi:L-ascorbate metabolism protein UlaG (beta-lactamase superfamily)